MTRISRSVSSFLGLTIIPFVVLSFYLPNLLFHIVSYSNSRNIDQQLSAYKNVKTPWRTVIVGSSEVLWGIDPIALQSGAGNSLKSPVFNMGWDGFSGGLTYAYSEALLEHGVLGDGVEELWVGINPTEAMGVLSPQNGNDCSALQKPVLSSAFGRDVGLQTYCGQGISSWLSLLRDLLPAAYYRTEIKSLLTGQWSATIPAESSSLPMQSDGYQPHLSIRDDFANYQQAVDDRVREKSIRPAAYAPLAPSEIEKTAAEGGLLSKWRDLARRYHKRLVLFALPTNPWLIDFTNSRDVYRKRSEIISKWANQNGLIYLDLGIQDGLKQDIYYSDVRHLSAAGAKLFSEELGRRYAIQLSLRSPN